MTKKEIEKWLEENTFECPRGLGRISPAQCEALRKRPSLYGKNAWLYKAGPLKPKQCEGCTEWRKFIKEDKMKCINCGEEKKIKARGLCGRCYERLKKEGKLPPLKKDIKKPLKIEVDFEKYPDILDEIKKRAEDEIRTVPDQIIWELKRVIASEERKIGGTL